MKGYRGQGLFGDVEAEAAAAAFIVKFEDAFEAVEGAVVHIGAGLGGVAYGWGFEGAFVERERVYFITALVGTELEAGFCGCAGLGAGGFWDAGGFGVGGFAEMVGTGGAEDFVFGLGVIGWDEAVEKGDEVAGGALGFAHE